MSENTNEIATIEKYVSLDRLSYYNGLLREDIDKKLNEAELNVENNFSQKDHNHDDKYYDQDNMDALLAGKADTLHDHDTYYKKDEIDAEFIELDGHLGEILDGIADTYETKGNVSAQYDSLVQHIEDVRVGLLGGEESYTLKQVSELISGNSTAIEIMQNEISNNYYEKSDIDAMSFITTSDIDEICGQTYADAREVTY